MGLLKMDFLGLRNLTVLADAIENIIANRGIEIDLAKLPLDDAADLRPAGPRRHPRRVPARRRPDAQPAQADGADGVRRHRGRAGPVPARARWRPTRTSTTPTARTAGRRSSPIHPELEQALEPILGETYHLVVYQEQVMAIAQQLAGYSLGRADLLRRAMGKKKKEILDANWEEFAAGMKGNGFSEQATKAIWDVLVPFSGYGFNKSHTAGYGMVSYWTALPQGQLPGRVHGRAAHLGRRRQGQDGGLPGRVPQAGHQGAAAGRQRVRAGLRPRRHRHPVRARRDPQRGRHGGRLDRRDPRRRRAATPRSPTSWTSPRSRSATSAWWSR